MLISRCDGMRMIKDGLVLRRMSATIREGPIAMRTGPRSRVDGTASHVHAVAPKRVPAAGMPTSRSVWAHHLAAPKAHRIRETLKITSPIKLEAKRSPRQYQRKLMNAI